MPINWLASSRLEHNKLGGFVVNLGPSSGPTAGLASSRLAAVSDRDGRTSLASSIYSLHHNNVDINAGEIFMRRRKSVLLHAGFSGEHWAVITSMKQLAGGAVRFASDVRALLCKVRSATDIGTLIVHRPAGPNSGVCAVP